MITENGIVTQANQTSALIKTIRSGACEGCSSKESCGGGEGHNTKEMTVTVKNTLNVETGDEVVIGIETKPMMILSFLLYVFPIILLILGAVIGEQVAPILHLNKSFSAMIFGFSFFGAAFLVIRKKQSSLTQKDEFKPFLVKKKRPSDSHHCKIS